MAEEVFAFLSHTGSEDRVVAADGGTDLVVLLLSVADGVELGGRSEHGASEPNGVTLHSVGDDLDLNGGGLQAATRELLRALNALLDGALQVALNTATEVLEHGGSSRENNVLVETTTNVDGAVLDDVVDDSGEGDGEVRGEDLGVEEDFGTQEALITDVNLVLLLCDLVDALLDLEPLLRLSIVLTELLGDIRADIAVLLLDTLGNLQRLRRGDGLTTLTVEGLDEGRDITTSEGDVLDRGSNDVTFSDGDNVGNSISRIDNGTSQSTLSLLGGPGSGQSQNGLDSNVETGNSQGLEEDLGGELTVLRGVERGLSLEGGRARTGRRGAAKKRMDGANFEVSGLSNSMIAKQVRELDW